MGTIQPTLVEVPDELLGERVIVRGYREEDAPDLWAAVDESRGGPLGDWMPWVKEYRAPEDALATIRRIRARWLLREDLVTAIFDRVTGRFVGGSGLSRIDWTIRKFEIGYWLRTSAIGHGYVTETVQLLTRLAFDRLEANRVEIRMDVRNTPSRAVPGAAGLCLRRPHAARSARHSFAGGRYRRIRVDPLEDYERLPWQTPV